MENALHFGSYKSRYSELLPPTFWTAINIDYETNICHTVPNSLKDLSSEKLLSDVCLLIKVVDRLPISLYRFLLQKAVALNRVSSIRYLLKRYPEKTYLLPIPDSLKNWSVFFKELTKLIPITNFFRDSTVIVLHGFLDIIRNTVNAQLQILDMNEACIDARFLVDFLNRLKLKKAQRLYVLKTGLIVVKEEELELISTAKTDPFVAPYFKLDITGLHIFNSAFSKHKLLELLELLRDDELLHFSVDLCRERFNSLFPLLRRFHHLQSLSLSYVEGFSSYGNLLASFAPVLSNFTHLKHLTLRGCRLSGCLRTLLRHSCEQDYLHTYEIPNNLNCCILHRGTIEYLDISSCRLANEDLTCLWEFDVTKSLKYLNLGCNILNATRLSETLKIMGSSLVVLDIESCLPTPELQRIFSNLEFLPKIKSINLKDLPMKVEDFELFSIVVKKLPNLRHAVFSRPSGAVRNFCNDFGSLMAQNKICITWYPNYEASVEVLQMIFQH